MSKFLSLFFLLTVLPCTRVLAEAPRAKVDVYSVSRVDADQLLALSTVQFRQAELLNRVKALVKAGKATVSSQPSLTAVLGENVRGGGEFHTEVWWTEEAADQSLTIRFALTPQKNPGRFKLQARLLTRRGETHLLGTFDDADGGVSGPIWMAFVKVE